ncbi:hypothetical protein KAI46_04050, partial [bacterium]|nr:hypothetical protein [bacterium]
SPHLIESAKDIVKGTGSFLSNVGRSIYSSDPHQDNILKVALGYDAAKISNFGWKLFQDLNPLMN